MPKVTDRTRRRALAAAAPVLVSAAALAGCGGGDTTGDVPASGLPESHGAAAVQRQFVSVVDHVSPQVVQMFGDTQAPGIGFAIPGNTVQRVADRLIGAGQ
jgi:hypothetical protein